MANPLVGKKITFTYETGFPGASIEIHFFSETQKTSTNQDPENPWSDTDDYDMVIVAPNIYMASWMGADGHVVTAVFNLNDMTINSTYSNPEPKRIPVAGVYKQSPLKEAPALVTPIRALYGGPLRYFEKTVVYRGEELYSSGSHKTLTQ